jgi:hypothetical protein
MCDGHDKESPQLLINKIVKEMIASISKILYKIILDKEEKPSAMSTILWLQQN